MTIVNNGSKEMKKSNVFGFSKHSKRVDWNTKRKYNYKYITSVF